MEKKKKILYLITKSNWGGAQKYVYELARAADSTGYEVVVAAGGTGEAGAASGQLFVKLTATNIRTIQVRHFMRNMSLWRDILAFFEVLQILYKERPDVLHLSSSKAGGIGAVAARLAGIKRIIFTSHGLTVDETWRPKLQRTLIYIGTWYTLQFAHHSIMISTETYKRAANMPGMKNRVSLIFNGIAPIDFLPKTKARQALDPNAKQTTLWIGGIGELHPNKNWPAAIEAMTTLPTRVHLYIIGEGEERPYLEQVIQTNDLQARVHLIGYLPAAQYLQAFDLFVLPSKKEGLPYVLLEAGLAELATVASDLPGNRDIIESGQNGLLVNISSNEFSSALQLVVRDESMRRTYGTNLKKSVSNKFSMKKMCEETFALYS